jgi:hypothetical protein
VVALPVHVSLRRLAGTVRWSWSGNPCGGEGSGLCRVEPVAVCGGLQARVDHLAEAERCHPGVEPLIVAADAAVAELAAAALGPISQAMDRSAMGRCCRQVSRKSSRAAQSRRACRKMASCSCRLRTRPRALVVHFEHSGQAWQTAPKVTSRRAVMRRVTPFGQVAVPAASSTAKSSMVNPPATAAGGITGNCQPGVLAG